MSAPDNVSHVSAPREVRLETNSHGRGTGVETGIETSITKRLIDKVLARPQVRQPVRQDVRLDAEALRQPVRKIPENLDHPRDCQGGGKGVLPGALGIIPAAVTFAGRSTVHGGNRPIRVKNPNDGEISARR